MRRSVGKRVATLYITLTVKNRQVFVTAREAFASCKVAQNEWLIESDRLSQHTAASHNPIRKVVCGSRICTHAR